MSVKSRQSVSLLDIPGYTLISGGCFLKRKLLKFKLWEVLLTNKKITKQDKTDRTFSYLNEGKITNEKIKICILRILIQTKNSYETITTYL